MGTRTKYFWLLVLVLIIASFFRLYHLTTVPPGLYPDEAIGGNQGLEAVRTGHFKLFYPENNGRAGLFINIQGVSAALLGATEPWALRVPSALLGILTVLGLYFLAKELFRESSTNGESFTNERIRKFGTNSLFADNVALLAAFFLATSFWHINFSRIGFDGIMAPFFLVWSVYLLVKALNSPNSRFCFLFSIFSGLIYGLGFHSYIAYRVTPVLILFILAYYIQTRWNDPVLRKKILLSAFCFLVASFLAALPIGIYFLTHPGDLTNRTSQISVFASAHPVKDLARNILKTLAMFNFTGDGNWRHNYPAKPELFWPVGMLFIIGIALGIKTLLQNLRFRAALRPNGHGSLRSSESEAEAQAKIRAGDLSGSENASFAFLFLWFALGAAPAVFSNDGIPHALRSILVIIPAMIFAAIGGITLYDFLKKRIKSFWLPAAAIIFLLLLATEAYTTYFAAWAKNSNTSGAFNADYVELGKVLNQLPQRTPKYVVVDAGGVIVNGIPMPAQTVMFVTDTYTPGNQAAKNIHYVLPNQENSIPKGAEIFYIR